MAPSRQSLCGRLNINCTPNDGATSVSARICVCVPFCLAVSAIAVIALNALAPIQERLARRGSSEYWVPDGGGNILIQRQLAAIMASQCVLCVASAVRQEACRCIFAAPDELRAEQKNTLNKMRFCKPSTSILLRLWKILISKHDLYPKL